MSEGSRKFQIVLFFVMSVLFFVSISGYSSFITPMSEELGFSPAQIGVILGATGFASLFARFPVGVIAQMFKKRKLMIQLGLLITVVAWLVAFFAPTVATLTIAKAAGGITGATWVMYTVLFSTFFKEKDIPKSIGTIQLASSIGPIIGVNVGGLFSGLMGYEYSIMVAVGAAALAIVLSFLLKEPQTSPASKPVEALGIAKNQLKDKNVWLIGLLATIPMMATYAYMDYLTPALISEIGGGPLEITMMANCFRISCIVAAPITGTFFYRKLGVVKTIGIGAVGTGLFTVLMPLMPNFPLLYAVQCLAGFAFTMNFTMLLALIIMGVKKEEQTTRMGLLQSIYSIGLMVGPLISGVLNETFSMTTCYMIIGGTVLVLAVFTKWLVPKGLDKYREEIDSENKKKAV